MPAGTIQPSQQRSRRTHRRVLAALETLLRERDFDEISVQDISSKAGLSVGAIYGRFRSKHAMVEALYERYDQRVGDIVDQTLASADWNSLTLEQTVERLVDLTIEHYERERGLLRLFAMPGSIEPPDGRMQANSSRMMERIFELLLAHEARFAHDNPKEAVAFGFYGMYSTARDWVLFPRAPQIALLPRDRDHVREYLTRLLVSFMIGAPVDG